MSFQSQPLTPVDDTPRWLLETMVKDYVENLGDTPQTAMRRMALLIPVPGVWRALGRMGWRQEGANRASLLKLHKSLGARFSWSGEYVQALSDVGRDFHALCNYETLASRESPVWVKDPENPGSKITPKNRRLILTDWADAFFAGAPLLKSAPLPPPGAKVSVQTVIDPKDPRFRRTDLLNEPETEHPMVTRIREAALGRDKEVGEDYPMVVMSALEWCVAMAGKDRKATSAACAALPKLIAKGHKWTRPMRLVGEKQNKESLSPQNMADEYAETCLMSAWDSFLASFAPASLRALCWLSICRDQPQAAKNLAVSWKANPDSPMREISESLLSLAASWKGRSLMEVLGKKGEGLRGLFRSMEENKADEKMTSDEGTVDDVNGITGKENVQRDASGGKSQKSEKEKTDQNNKKNALGAIKESRQRWLSKKTGNAKAACDKKASPLSEEDVMEALCTENGAVLERADKEGFAYESLWKNKAMPPLMLNKYRMKMGAWHKLVKRGLNWEDVLERNMYHDSHVWREIVKMAIPGGPTSPTWNDVSTNKKLQRADKLWRKMFAELKDINDVDTKEHPPMSTLESETWKGMGGKNQDGPKEDFSPAKRPLLWQMELRAQSNTMDAGLLFRRLSLYVLAAGLDPRRRWPLKGNPSTADLIKDPHVRKVAKRYAAIHDKIDLRRARKSVTENIEIVDEEDLAWFFPESNFVKNLLKESASLSRGINRDRDGAPEREVNKIECNENGRPKDDSASTSKKSSRVFRM